MTAVRVKKKKKKKKRRKLLRVGHVKSLKSNVLVLVR